MIKSKSDLTNLTVYDIADFRKVNCASSSKGNITKYTNGEKWIKTDYLGYESLAEVIASRVVKALGFQTVVYQPCFLSNNEYEARSACVSDSYTQIACEYSVGRLLQSLGRFASSADMMHAFLNEATPKARLQWVLEILAPLGINEYLCHALAECLWLDSILLNEDRHLFNLILIREQGNEFKFINFDYGGALLSDLTDYPLAMPLQRAMYKVKSKPFSTRFSSQLKMLEQYLPTEYSQHICIGSSDLYDYYEARHIQRCLDILQVTLSVYGVYLENSVEKSSIFSSR